MRSQFRRPRRRIIWEKPTEREVLRFLDHYPRLSDLIHSLDWLLEHDPKNRTAEQIDDKYWLIRTNRTPGVGAEGLPELSLIYHFDDDSVTFWDIRIEP